MKNLKQQIKEETNCKFVYLVRDIGTESIEAVYTSKYKAKKWIKNHPESQFVILRRKLL